MKSNLQNDIVWQDFRKYMAKKCRKRKIKNGNEKSMDILTDFITHFSVQRAFEQHRCFLKKRDHYDYLRDNYKKIDYTNNTLILIQDDDHISTKIKEKIQGTVNNISGKLFENFMYHYLVITRDDHNIDMVWRTGKYTPIDVVKRLNLQRDNNDNCIDNGYDMIIRYKGNDTSAEIYGFAQIKFSSKRRR